jgi:transposase
MAWRAVTDRQWEAIKQHLPKRRRSRKGGRPPLLEPALRPAESPLGRVLH